MKLIVVGASGLVGGNLLKTALATGHEAIGTYAAHAVAGLQPLRLEEENTVRELLEGFRPDAVVCCAGWSWVDGCEGDPERAVRENALQPSRLGGLALSVGARFLSFSTSYVFDGRAGPYDEAAATRPLSV
jgi:dTDP-4-dehydrorhamnose reductase